MKLNFGKSIKWHLSAMVASALLIAITLLVFFFLINDVRINEDELQKKLTAKYENFIFYQWYGVFQNDNNEGYHALKDILQKGGLAVLGSSELTNFESRFTTYNFLQKNLGVDVRAFGHAGYQSKAILTQLISVFNPKISENGQLVIILSPGWFATGEGTHDGLLRKEVATPIIISRIRENRNVSEEFKEEIFGVWDYFAPLNWLDQLLQKKRDLSFLNTDDSDRKPILPDIGKVDWKAWKEEAIKYEAVLSSNEYGINDSYFERYIKPKIGTPQFPFKISTGVPINENQEIREFTVLLTFLEEFKIKPIFVILPLNKKAYGNLNELDLEIEYVQNMIKEKKYPLLNFWFVDNEPGILTDVMHTGANGWVVLNEFIYNNRKK